MKRSTTHKILLALLAAMLTIMAVACGGGEPTPAPSADTPVPVPPTATPIPPSPTPEEVGPLSEYAQYDDPSGVFSIEYPADWTVDDRSRPGTVSIFWYPQEQYATMSLFLSSVTVVADPQAHMDALIDEWMIDASGFATDPDYEELSREVQGDESILLRFYYTGDGEPTQAGCFFEAQDSLFSALCFTAAEERWGELVDDFNYIVDGYVLRPSGAEGPSEYAEYVHPSGVFSIEYPQGWAVKDLSVPGQQIFITFSSEENGASIFVQLRDQGAILGQEEMNIAIDGVVSAGFGRLPEYHEVSRDVRADSSVLVVYTHTEDGVLMHAGTLFEQSGTLLSSLTVVAPGELFDSLADDFDHADHSYTIDETAWPY